MLIDDDTTASDHQRQSSLNPLKLAMLWPLPAGRLLGVARAFRPFEDLSLPQTQGS
jgi:hypothetical protein